MVVVALIAVAATALVTGVASYYAFKPRDNSEPAVNSKGEIYNNVQLAVEENNNQNNTLVLLVAILVFIKIIELIIFSIRAYKRSIKKKYSSLKTISISAQNPTSQTTRTQAQSTA